MTTWIKSHDALRDHPKLKRLCRLASIDKPTAIGYLHMFWWWCMKYAPDGDLSRFDDDDIDDGVEWSGESSFITLAMAAKFVDQDRTVHDWSDYGEALLRRREANAERMRNARAEHVQNTCETRVGPEKRREEKREKKKNIPSKSTSAKADCARHFPSFWERYPNKTAKSEAEKSFAKALKTATAEEIIAGLAAHLPAWATFEKRFIPHASTWLNQARWQDDPPEPDAEGWRPSPEADEAYLRQRLGVVS